MLKGVNHCPSLWVEKGCRECRKGEREGRRERKLKQMIAG